MKKKMRIVIKKEENEMIERKNMDLMVERK